MHHDIYDNESTDNSSGIGANPDDRSQALTQSPFTRDGFVEPTCMALWLTDDPRGVVAAAGDLHPYGAAKMYVAILHGLALASGDDDDERFDLLLEELGVLRSVLVHVERDMQEEVIDGFHDGVQEMLNDLVAPIMAANRPRDR